MTASGDLKDGEAAVREEQGVEWGAWRPAGGIGARVRRAGVVLHSSTWPRRLIPTGVAFAGIEAYAAHCYRRRNWMWEENFKFHSKLLQYTPQIGVADDIARRAIVEYFECVEIFWRPWLMNRGEIEGMHHYREAVARKRGVLGVFPHYGMAYAQFPIQHRFGVDAWVIASPHHYMDIGTGYDGRFAKHAREQYIDQLGPDRAIARRRGTDKPGAFEPALELLRSGATLNCAFDVGGSLPTPFLGRQLSLASGPAKLAHESEALVVPFVIRRRRQYPVLRFEEIIDPRDHEDPVSLQAAIAAVMERWALEEPWTVWALHTQPGGPPLITGQPLAEAA